jgi:hypothetical protein
VHVAERLQLVTRSRSCVGVTCGANIHNTQCSRHSGTPHLATPHHTAPHHYPNLTSNHRRHHCRAQATERWATQLRHQSALWAPYHAPLRGESPTETDGYLGACAWRVREREHDVGRQTWPVLGCLRTALASCLTPGTLAMLWAAPASYFAFFVSLSCEVAVSVAVAVVVSLRGVPCRPVHRSSYPSTHPPMPRIASSCLVLHRHADTGRMKQQNGTGPTPVFKPQYQMVPRRDSSMGQRWDRPLDEVRRTHTSATQPPV